MYVAPGRLEAVHQSEDAIVAKHGEVFATVARLEGGRHRAFGLRQPEQGGVVLRPHFLGPQRELVRSHRKHDGQPRRTVPVLESVSGARAFGTGRGRGGQRHGRSVGRRNRFQVHVSAQRHIRHGQRSGRECTIYSFSSESYRLLFTQLACPPGKKIAYYYCFFFLAI